MLESFRNVPSAQESLYAQIQTAARTEDASADAEAEASTAALLSSVATLTGKKGV